MEAYRTNPHLHNPVALGELVAQARVTRKHLDQWVTRALAAITPWTWSLTARLARTWKRNTNHADYRHSKERGAREAELAQDVAELHRTRYFVDCQRLPWNLRASYIAVVDQVRRLLDGGDWWKPRQYRDHDTGELTETVYLPEDTWSAQTALHWCVALLRRLRACISRVTEKPTPRYRPGETATGSIRGRTAPSVEEVRGFLAEVARRRAAAHPELPAQA